LVRGREQMNSRQIAVLCVLAVQGLASAQEGQTSRNNDRLKRALKRFPEADANKDGVLTMEEARAYRDKMTGGKKGRRGGNRGRGKAPMGQPITVSGKDVEKGKEIQGYNGLYMGHSFFRPAAEHLLEVIPDTRVVNHAELIVMAGGAGGSPKKLWEQESKRAAGQKSLDTRKVELMVMTYHPENNSLVEHYARWFDYAVAKNPNITFMVTIAWERYLYRADTKVLNGADAKVQNHFDEIVVPLRRKYPKNKILYCPYGLTVYELINRLNAGNLPGVKHVLDPDKETRAASRQKKEQLLNDELGHGGDLVSRLNALIWLQTIYDYELSATEKEFRVEGLPDIDLNEIAATVYKRVAPYNAVYREKSTTELADDRATEGSPLGEEPVEKEDSVEPPSAPPAPVEPVQPVELQEPEKRPEPAVEKQSFPGLAVAATAAAVVGLSLLVYLATRRRGERQ
jgi:hypothetical protein